MVVSRGWWLCVCGCVFQCSFDFSFYARCWWCSVIRCTGFLVWGCSGWASKHGRYGFDTVMSWTGERAWNSPWSVFALREVEKVLTFNHFWLFILNTVSCLASEALAGCVKHAPLGKRSMGVSQSCPEYPHNEAYVTMLYLSAWKLVLLAQLLVTNSSMLLVPWLEVTAHVYQIFGFVNGQE